jgi:hypothetical protein
MLPWRYWQGVQQPQLGIKVRPSQREDLEPADPSVKGLGTDG